jgi:hypothetical protein
MKSGDRTISGDNQLVQHAIVFYKTLFGPGDGNNFEIDSSIWGAEDLVSEQENAMLI